MPFVARQVRLDEPLPKAWRSAAIRRGTFHASAGQVLLGLGSPTRISLPPLNEGSTAATISRVLSEITSTGDSTEVGSVRVHAALPFDPGLPGIGFLSPIQVTAGGGTLTVTLLGADPDALDHLEARLHAINEPDPPTVLPTIVGLEQVPTTEGYETMVRQALVSLDAGALDKAVLSRSVGIVADADLDPVAVIDRMLEREPSCSLFSLPAGDGRFVGASPELLIGRRGRTVRSHPLAGTIARTEDDLTGLVQSLKNIEEHRLVVDDIAERMGPLVEQIDVPDVPEVVTLRAVRHLGTEIRASVGEGGPTALDLLAAIHPTPAIGGVPRSDALEAIAELEASPRGLFGGAVGWSDGSGDGDWVLGIRGALLSGNTAIVRAGAGIVRGSKPTDEARETRIKLLSILDALAPGCASLL
jgi:isochorismate synthase